MTPNKPGIWEWTDRRGVKRFVEVVEPLRGYLRVYWWGGYYNVVDSAYGKAEWLEGTWGNWIGIHGVGMEIYDKPDPEEMRKIREMD